MSRLRDVLRMRSWWFLAGVDVGMALALWLRRRLHLYALDAWGIDDDVSPPEPSGG